jgi:hypothetical protein
LPFPNRFHEGLVVGCPSFCLKVLAIRYYLNHKEEIDRDREESERMYRENAPKGEVVGIEGRGI